MIKPKPLTRSVLFKELTYALIPIAGLAAALLSGSFVLLDYVHVITGGTWTGIDLFMGLVISRVMRSLTVPERAEVAKNLTPKTLFLLPSLASVAITAGIYVAMHDGVFSFESPLILSAGIIVAILTVQGFGFLLPNSLRILLEITKEKPNGPKIVRLNLQNLRVAGSQAIFQILLIFVMANLAV
jgi:hypothetical protein